MQIAVVTGGNAIGHEWPLPTSLLNILCFNSFTQASFNAFSGALANDCCDHVYGKWNINTGGLVMPNASSIPYSSKLTRHVASSKFVKIPVLIALIYGGFIPRGGRLSGGIVQGESFCSRVRFLCDANIETLVMMYHTINTNFFLYRRTLRHRQTTVLLCG